MTKLYIANLPYSATEDMLRHIFEHVGAVRSATIVKDPQTGFSKGFGFVEMENEEDADNAIAQFNGDTYNGRAIRVERSRDSRKSA